MPSIQSTEYLIQTVYNGSGSTINRGSIVSFIGGDGSYPIVEKAVSNNIHDSDVIGLAIDDILNGEYGSIVVNGILDGINTLNFEVGDKLYLSPTIDGAIINSPPTAPNHAIFIGFCIKKDAIDGAIYVSLNTGTHLDLLHDVNINLPSSGDVLFFNENNIWVNKKLDVYNISGAVNSGDYKNIVFQTGNQNISGIKTFFHRPILSGSQIQSNQSGLAMLGEVVTINGSQTITGPKTFSANVGFSDSTIDYTTSEVIFTETDFILDNYSSSGLASNLREFFVDINTNQIINGRKTFKSGIKLISQNSSALDVSGSAIFTERPTVNGTGVLLSGDIDTSNYAENSDIFNSAVEWTVNHTLADGTRYLAGDLVYSSGKVYKANYDNESLPVTDALYWTDLGPGYRLNIDGRDIPNIPQVDVSNLYPNDNPSGFITGVENVVYTTGDQAISGKKTFLEGLEAGTGNISTLYVIPGSIGINNESPQGALDVSGSALFSERPTVNGTGVVLSGEIDTTNFYTNDNPSGYIRSTQTGAFYAASNPSGFITGVENVVYTTGDQAISGKKTFLEGLEAGTGNISTLYVIPGSIGINNESPQGALDVSGSALFSERPTVNGTGVVLSGEIDTTNFYTNDNPSGYIRSTQTGAFYAASNPSGFITGVDTSNFYTNDNPSGFITGVENVVYTTGDQSVSGIKTFVDGINVGNPSNPTTNTLYVRSGEVGINNDDPQGALDVSGFALFSERPTVNGTGVLLQGEIQSNTIISGVVYSAQVNVKNNNGSTIYKGQPVYIAGAQGGNILVKLASNSSEQSSSKTLGLIVQDSLANNAFGTVITDGLLENFNASAANAGDPIWLGYSGSLLYGLANKPHAPNHMVYLGVVTRAQNNGEVFVKVQNGYELDELHDLNVTGAVSGQFLFKNNNLWSGKFLGISDISGLQTSLNDKQASGNYYLSSNPSGFITGVDTSSLYPRSNPSGYIASNSTLIPGAASISNIIQIAQTGYDAIVPQENTLYIII